MRNIELDKIVVHICAGEFGNKLNNAKKILGLLTNGRKPIDTVSKTKLPKWGLRPGLKIGAKIILRKKEAEEFLKKALKAKGFTINKRSFDKNGNVAFGIKEYIDIEGMKYDPTLGVFGFDVMVNTKRKGFRVKKRRLKPSKIGKNHKINRDECQKYFIDTYNVKLE